MDFETYARKWLAEQILVKSTRKTTRQALDVYILPVIGDKEIADITEADIDEIFLSERLFNREPDFTERTFRVLTSIFDKIMERQIIQQDPVLHIYSPVVLAHERLILAGKDVELTERSLFADVSCMWLKSKRYAEVTYNLYCHFLNSFVHPFIGKKPIGLVDQNNIRNIYTYFNTVVTNKTWIGQIHLVMRTVFQFAIDKGLITANPMMQINDPHLESILELDREKKNAIRAAFSKYGFRKTKMKDLSATLYAILHVEEEYQNNRGITGNGITFREVFDKWYNNTQDGILSEATASASFHSMDIYALPNIGDKPIQSVSLSDLKTITDVFALMGNTADFYILAKLRSLYDYALQSGHVTDNIAYDLRSANNLSAEKKVLSDEEIKKFFSTCDEMYSMYGCLFAVILCTGLRIREGMALSSTNIDYDLNTVKITNQMKDGKLVPATKTRLGRKLKLARTALAFLEGARECQRAFEQSEGYDNRQGLIFTTKAGGPLSYTNVMRKLDEIAYKMGRPDLTPHTLRHTYMTISSRCGENLDEIQRTVGHGYASDVITEYLHQTDEGIHDAAVKKQNYLKNIMKKYGG